MSKSIKLTQGQSSIVDDDWFDELNSYKWYAWWNPYTKSYYARRHSRSASGQEVSVFMHVVVAGTPVGMTTDHINRNTLDNQSRNLRVCTKSQNGMNRGKNKNNTSGFKGVTYCQGKWMAQIKVNGKNKYLGRWSTPEEAAIAYDMEARNSCGEFAVLNFNTETLI